MASMRCQKIRFTPDCCNEEQTILLTLERTTLLADEEEQAICAYFELIHRKRCPCAST